MKVNKIIAAGILSAVIGSSAFAQTVINVTGATAFRAASHGAIVLALEDVEYAWVGADFRSSSRAIFKGKIGEEDYIIRTSWSNSGTGIASLLDQTTVQVLALGTPVSSSGIPMSANDATYEQAVAKFSFSDVAQSATNRPTPGLQESPAGVVPFMFVASKSAIGSGFTNVTSQQFEAIYSTGSAPLSLFTGNAEDSRIVAPTGRASSSGTRISVLAETGYGINNDVIQWGVYGTGLITIDDMYEFASGTGYPGNGDVRALLQRESGADEPLILGYLTVSDALALADANDAQPLTYNGVEYSEENVTSGKYTLWGYQQLFNVYGLEPAEEAFKTNLLNAIPVGLGDAGISRDDMRVTRFGGEGGLVLPD